MLLVLLCMFWMTFCCCRFSLPCHSDESEPYAERENMHIVFSTFADYNWHFHLDFVSNFHRMYSIVQYSNRACNFDQQFARKSHLIRYNCVWFYLRTIAIWFLNLFNFLLRAWDRHAYSDFTLQTINHNNNNRIPFEIIEIGKKNNCFFYCTLASIKIKV